MIFTSTAMKAGTMETHNLLPIVFIDFFNVGPWLALSWVHSTQVSKPVWID